MHLLVGLFVLIVCASLAFFFPVRNEVRTIARPWVTQTLLLVNGLTWFATAAALGFGSTGGPPPWLDQLAFTGDFSKPWTLATASFLHTDTLRTLAFLWMLYLIGPPLEERLKPVGLLVAYLVGATAVVAVCGAACNALGLPTLLAGIAPAFFFLLGLYLILYPFESFSFAYNLLFFAFCGTVRLGSLYFALFAVALHAISAQLSPFLGPEFAIRLPADVARLDYIVPLPALAIGATAATFIFGLEALVGKTGEAESPRGPSGALDRALDRIATAPAQRRTRPRLSRKERKQLRLVTRDGATAEQIELLAEQWLYRGRTDLLIGVYECFRERFPERSLGAGLQAAIARKFAEDGQEDLAVDAYRRLLRSHGDRPVAAPARLELARLLAHDPAAIDETIGLLEEFLRGSPPTEQATEARRLLARLVEASGREDTYAGLGPYKVFRFSKLPAAQEKGETDLQPPEGKTQEHPAGTPPTIISARTTAPTAPEIVPASLEATIGEARARRADEQQVGAAIDSAQSFAVILLPGPRAIGRKAIAVLADFWSVASDEALERLRACRGVLLDDAPQGRATVLARKLDNLGLPVALVPILPEISYPTCEEVLELHWDDRTCTNLTPLGRRSFDWRSIRLANAGRVGLRGAGAAYRLVLDLFVTAPRCHLRFWQNTLNYARSSLGDRRCEAADLRPVAAFADKRATAALKTPSFRAFAKKSGTPLDFHSIDELDHYNRWFLYAAFGIYRAGG